MSLFHYPDQRTREARPGDSDSRALAIEITELLPDRPVLRNEISAPADVDSDDWTIGESVRNWGVFEEVENALKSQHVVVHPSRLIVGVILPTVRERHNDRVRA